MSIKKTLIFCVVVIVGAVIASLVIVNREPKLMVSQDQAAQPAKVLAPEIPEPAPMRETPVVETKPVVKPASKKTVPVAAPPEMAIQVPPPANPQEKTHDPGAREALSLVGADPVAEKYWVSAINNPDLPANERKNLIEDLNEDGLSDPKHPSAEDIPLIVNRLRLIEKLAPDAMDQVNADAFAEAGKDLQKLLNGQKVQ